MSTPLQEYATADELRAVLGEGWAICRSTPKNRERYARCITRKQYREAEAEALRRRAGPKLKVCFHSHRARDKAFGRIPKRVGFFSLHRSTGKGVYELTEAELELLAGIKGVARFRDGPDLLRCWS